MIPIVQPLALGDGELVPPLHEVAQSYVHLPIIDAASRGKEDNAGRGVFPEPSQEGKNSHLPSTHLRPGTMLSICQS